MARLAGAVVAAVAGAVLVEGDVEDPVKTVLDRPLVADGAGEHPVAGGAEIVEEDLEGASEGDRIEQAEHAGEGVVAEQTILQAEEFPEPRLAVRGELGEVDAALRAADRGHQRDRQDVEQRVPLGIAPPRVGDLSKGVDQGHMSSSGDTRKNPDQPETEALFFKCDPWRGFPHPVTLACGSCEKQARAGTEDESQEDGAPTGAMRA